MGACPHHKIISSDHRFLKRGVRCIVAYAKKSPRGVPRSGGLGDEIPHKNSTMLFPTKSVNQLIKLFQRFGIKHDFTAFGFVIELQAHV